MTKPAILVVCTANSARSQMTEGLLRHHVGEVFDVESAGTVATLVRPEAIAVMREIGIDITAHRSKSVDEFRNRDFRYLITVCDHARQSCPVLPGVVEQIHWNLEDPAAVQGDEAARLAAFRDIRDQIAFRVRAFAALRASRVSA